MSDLYCPFCGDKEPNIDSDQYGSNYICCSYCGAKSESAKTEEECWENWNKRTRTGNIESYRQGFMDAKILIIRSIDALKVELKVDLDE